MNRELSISIFKDYAQELSYKLSIVLDEPELLAEITDRVGVEAGHLRTAMEELEQRGGAHCFSVAVWQALADEAQGCDGIGDTFRRIQDAIQGIPSVKRKQVERPARAPGNVATEYFTNTSRFPDALVKQMISFILEGGRLPSKCEVVIEQGTSKYCSGSAFGASKSRNSGSSWRLVGANATAKGGSIYLRANIDHLSTKVRGNYGGYLPIRVNGAIEDFFATLSHEIRHVYQGFKPIYRESKKVRKHTFGTNAKLSEIDASLFEVRALRRFRREWSSDTEKVLPLP